MSASQHSSYDAVIVGGGHNGLAAAAYLGRAGLKVLLLERLASFGGAAVSTEAFPGTGVRLSRYSYLVSLLPQAIARELELDVELRSRRMASYTPTLRDGVPGGLLVEHDEGVATADSFRSLTGSDEEYDAWRRFYAEVEELAGVIAPTLTSPLPTERQLRATSDSAVWDAIVRRPLGETIEERFRDDVVRGVVATDALIGTFADLNDPSLVQNRCFLYHLIGNGTGEWRVPVGGMGAVSGALERAARAAGAELISSAGVSAIRPGAGGAEVHWHDGTREHSVTAQHVLSNVAPWVLRILLGEDHDDPKPVGAQLKLNVLLRELPRLKSGHDPAEAFAGTLHIAQGYSELAHSFAQAASGRIPTRPPGEFYCHSLTDESILGPLAGTGAHTLTYFGLHMPASLFDGDLEARKSEAVHRVLATIDEHLERPLLDSVVTNDDTPCIEAKVPQEIEAELAMPGGHIFHGDLAWPWASNRERLDTPAQRWGVATDHESLLLCGSGARRGGAVSALGGHNAAQAVLESR